MAPLLSHLAAALSLILILQLPSASAENATINWMEDVPKWQEEFLMKLQLTVPLGEATPFEYSIFPLTPNTGLNDTNERTRLVRSQIV